MQLFFQNSAWAWLAGLVLVPLLVHLVARARPQNYRYPSLRFLQEVVRKSARWQKPQDWLVWLLRTLAVLAVILAILGPLLMKSGSAPGAQKTLLVVIDRSASMAYEDRFSEAASQALLAVKSQKPDLANLIFIDSAPQSFYREPGPAVGGLLEAIERAEVSSESGSPEAALALAAAQLGEVEGQRELLVISDFQKSGWENLAWPVPKGVNVTRVQVGAGEGRNQAVKALFVEPAEPVVGQKANLVAQVRNFSGEPMRVPIYANIEGARVSREMEVAAWGEAEVVFPLSFTEAGEKLVQVRLAGDAFPSDDWRGLSVPVRESLTLATRGEASVWPQVAKVLPWLEWRDEGASGVPDFLWVGQWDGEGGTELRQAREAGTTVFLQPGAGSDSAAVANVLGGLLGVLGDQRMSTSKEGWRVKIAAESAAVFELFRDGEYGNPFAGRFYQRGILREFGISWASYEDGISALHYVSGEDGVAPLVLFNMGLAPPRSDWSEQPNFVPFLGELLLTTRAVSARASGGSSLAGTVLQWSPGPDGDGGGVELSAGEESVSILRKKKEGLVYYESEAGASPGVWRWQSGGREVAQQVINFPAEESDLRLLGDGESGEFKRADGFERELALASGWALWPWLILAAVVFLIGESALVLWRPKSAQTKGGAFS